MSDSLVMFAAGSLQASLQDVVNAFAKQPACNVAMTCGPSGLLLKAIAGGAQVDLFAAANMEHPATLEAGGWGSPVALFAQNNLCALVQPGVSLTPDNFLDVLMAPQVRVGTSTPCTDPCGDYTWEFFRKADQLHAGSYAALAGKALQLSGGTDSPRAPAGRNQYAWIMAEQAVDVFLTYRTNAVQAQRELPMLELVDIPDSLAVTADYGLVVCKDAAADAWKLTEFILSSCGQHILRAHGFRTVMQAGQKAPEPQTCSC